MVLCRELVDPSACATPVIVHVRGRERTEACGPQRELGTGPAGRTAEKAFGRGARRYGPVTLYWLEVGHVGMMPARSEDSFQPHRDVAIGGGALDPVASPGGRSGIRPLWRGAHW
jgi:hypothetical protein